MVFKMYFTYGLANKTIYLLQLQKQDHITICINDHIPITRYTIAYYIAIIVVLAKDGVTNTTFIIFVSEIKIKKV
jgi:hypothetical protein